MVCQSSTNRSIANRIFGLIKNYEKNMGIFDMISMDSEKTTETQWLKKVLVSFTFVDNEVQKVI
jgi:hypothetical protein